MRRNFHVLPTNTATPAGLQRFERRFFCREARCIMLCRHDAARIAVSAFSGCKDAFAETRSAQEHFANSRDFDNVYADGNDHKR